MRRNNRMQRNAHPHAHLHACARKHTHTDKPAANIGSLFETNRRSLTVGLSSAEPATDDAYIVMAHIVMALIVMA